MKTLNVNQFDDYMPVTEGLNDYPEPETGIAIFSNSFQQLENINQNFPNSKITIFYWRNGWDYCKNTQYLILNKKDAQAWYEKALHEDYFNVETSKDDKFFLAYPINSDIPESYIKDFEEANLCYHEDVHNYKLGVFISNEDYNINWNN